MRRVKIVTIQGLSCTHNGNYEKPLNKAFEEIEENGGKIINTNYCVSDNGTIEGVVIEYEAKNM